MAKSGARPDELDLNRLCEAMTGRDKNVNCNNPPVAGQRFCEAHGGLSETRKHFLATLPPGMTRAPRTKKAPSKLLVERGRGVKRRSFKGR